MPAHVVTEPAPVEHGWKPHGPSVGLGEALGLGDTLALGDGLSGGDGVAVGVGAGVAVGVGATVGVAGRAVGGAVDPQAARLKAAIAVPMTVVSFMAV